MVEHSSEMNARSQKQKQKAQFAVHAWQDTRGQLERLEFMFLTIIILTRALKTWKNMSVMI